MAQPMPLPLTVSCFSKIQIGFTFLVPAHPGSPGQRAVKRVSVCSKVESLWLKVSKNNKKYIVAGIYRHPNKDIRDFSVQLEITLENISKKKTPCIIAGDINIDFAKYGVHHETTDYVNNLLVNNFVPMIIMPSRATANTAAIIDHIYYYEVATQRKIMHTCRKFMVRFN